MRTDIGTNSAARRWLVLAVTVAAQFMVILDVAVVNVALPSISQDLHFSQESLQWVITAYSIVFGGTLLLGRPAGRSARSPAAVHGGRWAVHASARCCPVWPGRKPR